GRPVIRRGRPAAYRESSTVVEAPAEDFSEAPEEAHPMIAAAREASANPTDEVPLYIVRQFSTRYQSGGDPPQWKAEEAITADLVAGDGREEYRNPRINGKNAEGDPYEGETSPVAEFTKILSDLLAPQTAARFTRRGEE